MARRKKITLLTCFFVILVLIPVSYIYGGMKIQLRDGRTVDVPVNKEDIVSIIFEDRVPEPSQGMVSYWKFDEGTGFTARDSAGTTNGVVYGAKWVPGVVKTALSFDEANSGVLFSAPFIFHQRTDATLEFWLKKDDEQHQSVFWTRGDGDDKNRFNIYTDSAFGIDYRSPTGDLHHLGRVAIPSNQFVHIAITRSANTYRIYVNGRRVSESTDAFPDLPNSPNWYIALRPGFVFKGIVDEVAALNRALGPEEIMQHYENGRRGMSIR